MASSAHQLVEIDSMFQVGDVLYNRQTNEVAPIVRNPKALIAGLAYVVAIAATELHPPKEALWYGKQCRIATRAQAASAIAGADKPKQSGL
jgi:hypothetical protein